MNNSIELIKLRNDFYRDSYRKMMLALLLSILVIVVLSATLVYLVTHPPAPRYFATTTNGRIMPLVPLDKPNLANSALLQWANTAAISAYTYNFVNYRKELQTASDFFTPDGWRGFMNALESSNNLKAIIDKKLIVSAVATGAPVILEQGVVNGVYSWRVQMPMLVTYQSASEFLRQSVVVTMLVTRISTLDSPRGIAIAWFNASGTGL